jgi:two-component system, LuxR family, response regulator FixJ
MVGEPIVFVVDDDDSFRSMLGRLLKSVGLVTQIYPSANEFLEDYDPDQPGCLLLDIRMSGMSGLEMQKQLAARQVGLPIIFVTGHGDITMAVQCMKAGAVDFIEKPFREQVLIDRVRQAFEQDARQRVRQTRHFEL